jgi:hypothetical protein
MAEAGSFKPGIEFLLPSPSNLVLSAHGSPA